MSLREICRGRWGSVIMAVLAKQVCPAVDFIAEQKPGDKAKLMALFERYAEYGPIPNREKFKKVADNLFEFKSFQLRMFCYQKGRQLVLTHGVKKKRDDLRPADIERAKRIRNEYEGIQITFGKAGITK